MARRSEEISIEGFVIKSLENRERAFREKLLAILKEEPHPTVDEIRAAGRAAVRKLEEDLEEIKRNN